MYKLIAAFSLVLLLSVSVQADISVIESIKRYIPNAEKIGEGRLNYIVWNVYDATLYAPDGKYKDNKPLALNLYYLRSIRGKDIADKSVEEIRNQGFKDEVLLAIWHKQMRRVFTDVKHGTVYTGIKTDIGHTIILKNGKKVGIFKDPKFSSHFFDIWLGYKTSQPALRKKLLGNK